MKDRLLRAMSRALARAREPLVAVATKRTHAYWIGHPVLDPDGTKIGHVTRTFPDGGDGLWVEFVGDWGVLDLFEALGCASHATFTFHEDDFEEQPDGALRLRAEIGE